ncbi:MAG: superoxide dismutase family protein [Casimicrobiaceae bacterium]
MAAASTAGRPTIRVGALVFALLVVVALSGCDTLKSLGSAGSTRRDAQGSPGLGASLKPVGGSAVQGAVGFKARSNGVTMVVALNGLAPGRYRVMVHANGICTSPNGFSAGPPWHGPGGDAAPMLRDAPIVTTNSEGSAALTVYLPGATLEGPNGVLGRSVVVHQGSTGPLEAVPDVPNGRIACGVIGPIAPLF